MPEYPYFQKKAPDYFGTIHSRTQSQICIRSTQPVLFCLVINGLAINGWVTTRSGIKRNVMPLLSLVLNHSCPWRNNKRVNYESKMEAFNFFGCIYHVWYVIYNISHKNVSIFIAYNLKIQQLIYPSNVVLCLLLVSSIWQWHMTSCVLFQISFLFPKLSLILKLVAFFICQLFDSHLAIMC